MSGSRDQDVASFPSRDLNRGAAPRRTYVVWLTTFERSYMLFPAVVEATSHDEAAEKAPVPAGASISSVIVCDAITGASRRFQVSRTVELSAIDGEVAQ